MSLREYAKFHGKCIVWLFIMVTIIGIFVFKEYRDGKKFHERIQKQIDSQKYFLERLERSLNGE